MRTIKTYSNRAPFYNALIGSWATLASQLDKEASAESDMMKPSHEIL
jgi:hypothetical protein